MGRRTGSTTNTESKEQSMWERWKAGWTLHQIGHLFYRPPLFHNVLVEDRWNEHRSDDGRSSSHALSKSRGKRSSRSFGHQASPALDPRQRIRRALRTVAREITRQRGSRRLSRPHKLTVPSWERALFDQSAARLPITRALASLMADNSAAMVARSRCGMAQHTYPCDERHYVVPPTRPFIAACSFRPRR